MNPIKVSVIVPVYNGEKILEKNLLMLSKQTLKEIEFILVNDASTDNSLNILLAFKEVFPDKFIVINSEKNRGPGGARNIGLSYARGEYIGFMDQDDYCHQDMFKELYNEAISGDYDIVKCGFYDKRTNKSSAPMEIKGELNDDTRYDFTTNILYIWNKIFKKELIDKMSMHFRENVIDDDTDFTIEACLLANKVSSIPNAYYYYNFEGESTSRSKIFNIDKHYVLMKKLFDTIQKRIESTDYYNVGLKAKAIIMLNHIMNILYALFINPDFSCDDMITFDKFTKSYLPTYYTLKKENATNLCDIVYNELTENPEQSYKNLITLRNKIQSGQFDREMQKKNEVD